MLENDRIRNSVKSTESEMNREVETNTEDDPTVPQVPNIAYNMFTRETITEDRKQPIHYEVVTLPVPNVETPNADDYDYIN